MNIERICITLITRLFFDSSKGGLDKGLLSSIKEQYDLENISIRYFKQSDKDRPHVMLHIIPRNTNYKLSGNFILDEGRIIFNIKNKDDSDTGLLFEYIIDTQDNTIKHVYKLTDSKPPRIHNTSVFSSNFVKLSNPYYTINKLLELIKKSDKPNLIRIISSLEEAQYALRYIIEHRTDSMLRELKLDLNDITYASKVFTDAKSKKAFDKKLRLKFAYYSRFMRRNIKIYYPENLYEIPQTKENYVTNNFYTNNLATRYGNYYEDIRQVFLKKFMISKLNHYSIKVEEYIMPFDFRFQKPFTSTDIFLHYFGKRLSSMDKFNLTTVENVKNLFSYIELVKSVMFMFVSLYNKIPKVGTNTLNLNIKLHQLYPCLSWTKSISSEVISEINITINTNISKKGINVDITLCKTKCKPLECLDVIEIPYKNEILPINIKKMHPSKFTTLKGTTEEIYKSLEDNRNIPLEVFINSIEGAFLSNNLNERFLSSLRKRYYETDDFSNKDETLCVNEQKELSEEDYLQNFPQILGQEQDVSTEIIKPPVFTDEHEDEDIELDENGLDENGFPENENIPVQYSEVLKPVSFIQLEEHIKLQSEYTNLLIKLLKLQIEYNKLSTKRMAKSSEYNKIKLQITNLNKEYKEINLDLEEERYINYDEELNPDEIEAYYDELEQYRDELYDKLYELKPTYEKLSIEYNEITNEMRKLSSIFIIYYENKISDLIKNNPDVKFTKSTIILQLEQEEKKTRIIIKSVEEANIEEDILKGEEALEELSEEKGIDIGYNSSISKLKDKILDGLSDVAKGLIAVKNKAMKTEIETTVKEKYDEQLLNTALKELQLNQEKALKRIEQERQAQIEKFAREDRRFKSELESMEQELSIRRTLEERQQEIENNQIIFAKNERFKLENDEILQLELQIREKELQRLAEEERLLLEQIEKERKERALSWESKIRELEQYIESQQAKLDKIPTLHKYRYRIYKLTILIKNAQRLLDNEIALRRYNEKIYKLELDYEIAKKNKDSTEEYLKSPNGQLNRMALNAVKNVRILQESIEEIENKIDTIKEFVKAQRERLNEQYRLGLIKTLPDIDEALLKHKNELIALIKTTKQKIK